MAAQNGNGTNGHSLACPPVPPKPKAYQVGEENELSFRRSTKLSDLAVSDDPLKPIDPLKPKASVKGFVVEGGSWLEVLKDGVKLYLPFEIDGVKVLALKPNEYLVNKDTEVHYRRSATLDDLVDGKDPEKPKAKLKGFFVEGDAWVRVVEAGPKKVEKEGGEIEKIVEKINDLYMPMEIDGKAVLTLKVRGKPIDDKAPPKPKNAFQQCNALSRPRLKAERPELAMDLKAMAEAMKEAWEKMPQEEKDMRTQAYEDAMAIWKPKWAAYKETRHYKDWFEVKQDWVDIRGQKTLKKKMGKDAPKRPRSGYMIHASEIREKVQAEVFAAGGGMADIGGKIAEYWAGLSEAAKAKYGEQSVQQKEAYDITYAQYIKTDSYGQYCDAKNNMDATQKLKKIGRTHLDEAPKKPASSYALFRNENMPKICEENKGKSCGELGKIVATAWANVSEAKKAEYREQADKLKEQWEEDVKSFKVKDKYITFLETRQKLKQRQNRMVNLREYPKRPSSVFAVYAKKHKADVPQGKGEGLGRDALKKLFETPEAAAEKEALAKQETEFKEQWTKDVVSFKDGPKFKQFQTTDKKVKQEFMNEAMKVMTLKFLIYAPKAPPRSPFAVFVGEKRGPEGSAEGEPKSKAAKKAEVVKCMEEWRKLGKDTKAEYDKRRKEELKTFQEKCKEYMTLPKWQEYMSEAKKLKVPVQKLLDDKKDVMKKLKNGMIFIPIPEKPESFPEKPMSAAGAFKDEHREKGLQSLVLSMSVANVDHEQLVKNFAVKAAVEKAIKADVASSAECDLAAVTLELSAGAVKVTIGPPTGGSLCEVDPEGLGAKIAKSMADVDGIGDMSNGTITVTDPAVKKEAVSIADISRLWQRLTPEGRKPYEEAFAERVKEYSNQMKDFKNSDEGKSFFRETQSALRKRKVNNAKATYLKDIPKKPSSALSDWYKAHTKDVKKEDPSAKGPEVRRKLTERWQAMDAEERKKIEDAGKAKVKDYDDAMAAFKASENWKKYLMATKVQGGAKPKAKGKAKASAGPPPPKKPAGAPERPLDAFKHFCKDQAGKPIPELHKAFRELPEDEKKKLQEEAAERTKQYQQDLAEYEKKPEARKYKLAIAAFEKRKRLNDARSRFLKNEPKRPVGAYMIFINKKRPEVTEKFPELKGLGPVQQKLAEMWKGLSEEERKEYQDTEKQDKEEYEDKLKEFHATPDYKKYQIVMNRLNHKPGAPKAKAKASSGPKIPEPANLPKKPPSGFFHYCNKQREAGVSAMKQLTEGWTKLGAEGQKEYMDEVKALNDKYETDMKEFQKSVEGKRYLRLKAAVDKKTKLSGLKQRFLGGKDAPKEPKRPATAYFLFLAEKRPTLPPGSMGEIARAITDLWKKLEPEDKKVWEDKAKELKVQYDKELAEYKANPLVKQYNRAVTGATAKPTPKAKAAVKAKAKAGAKPASAAKATAAAASSSDSDAMGSDSDDSSGSSDSD